MRGHATLYTTGLYREYAIAIQDEVGDTNEGQCVIRHSANYVQHSRIYA